MSPYADFHNHPVALASGVTAAAIVLFALKYNDRAVFEELPPGIAFTPGWPLLGLLPNLFTNKDKLHDWVLSKFKSLDTLTMTDSSLGVPLTIKTIEPRNIEHILRNNFANYVKDPRYSEAVSDLLGHGIFNANGDTWKYQRKSASQVFNVKNFREHFTDIFVQKIDKMNNIYFSKACETGKTVDFHDVMFNFTLDSFVLLGFGVELNALNSKEKVPFAASFDVCQMNTVERLINPICPIIEKLQEHLMPWKMSIKDHIKVLNDYACNAIHERREKLARGEQFKDLLSRFMNARNEKGEVLCDQELRDVVLNFVIAGRDTTAQALSWTFYNLCLHPCIKQKLLKEINAHITDDIMGNSPALYEAIKRMTYAHAIFHEVLRLHPSVPINQKYALDDDIWPDGTHVRKGDIVAFYPWCQGRSEKVWGPDAKQFKPERWLTPDGELRHVSQGMWPAFNGGPRTCLGQNLATLEALVVITSLVRRYEFILVPGQDITYQVSLTLPMKYGMNVYVKKRSAA